MPMKFINKVTDEYYHLDTMFTGVVAAAADKTRRFTAVSSVSAGIIVNSSASLKADEKKVFSGCLTNLSVIKNLDTDQKLSGNKERPNISTPRPA
jgi:hypothetical protein